MTATGQLAESMTVTRIRIWPLVREQVRTLSPAYFAMVMATGIVVIAAHLTGMFLWGASSLESASSPMWSWRP